MIQHVKKYSHFPIIFLTAALFLAGCGSREERSPASMILANSASQNTGQRDTSIDIASQSNAIQNWGQGVQFNDQNQPLSCIEFQEKYKDMSVHFIGPEEKTIWLTFDEGYENGYTENILNTLKEKNCPAVFFITGQYARENETLIKRMIAEGHAVGNHSWAHPAGGMPPLSTEEQTEDLMKLHQYMIEQYNYEMTLFRYPAGIFSDRSLALIHNMGYHTLFWSFAYADWDPSRQTDPSAAYEKLCARLHPGAIYLLHAVSSTNAEILGNFIDYARSEGYRFSLPE